MKKLTLILLLPLISCSHAMSVTHSPAYPSDSLQKAASSIIQCISNMDNPKITVAGIRADNSDSNGLTVWLSESLTSALAGNKSLHVLERGRLKELISENARSLDDLFDTENAKELGKLLNADLIINGTLTKKQNSFDLNLRVADCETGKIIPGCGFRETFPNSKTLADLWNRKNGLTIVIYPREAPATVYIDNTPIGAGGNYSNVIFTSSVKPGTRLLKIEAPGYPTYEQSVEIKPLQQQTFSIRLLKPMKVTFWQEDAESGEIIGNHGKIYTGRSYRFCFKTNRNCYIYVFNKGTSGKIFPLIPNEKIKQGNHILAGEETRIPSVGAFPLNDPKGTEKIYVIGSVKPLDNLDKIARILVREQNNQTRSFQRQVKTAGKKNMTKDYGLPTTPAVCESVSLNPNDGVFMELTYSHK
ncbi:MAG: DUF4384 domain-containing protein [Desulfobacteraceae bacterium]|nr:DUF4384 domain-containing protein [Desulfobacteraceae bacterium]